MASSPPPMERHLELIVGPLWAVTADGEKEQQQDLERHEEDQRERDEVGDLARERLLVNKSLPPRGSVARGGPSAWRKVPRDQPKRVASGVPRLETSLGCANSLGERVAGQPQG